MKQHGENEEDNTDKFQPLKVYSLALWLYENICSARA
jgi:hypothetical protein